MTSEDLKTNKEDLWKTSIATAMRQDLKTGLFSLHKKRPLGEKKVKVQDQLGPVKTYGRQEDQRVRRRVNLRETEPGLTAIGSQPNALPRMRHH